MWIIKFGGSLLSSGQLQQWLSMTVAFGGGKLVVVPGGGIFAKHILTAQQQWQFNDQTAHSMALLAMEQYAHLLKFYAPEFTLADSIKDLQNAVQSKRVPIWLPFKMVSQRQDIPANWNTSSDSLALCLAKDIGAKHTMLVKSSHANAMNARQLSAHGMVDHYFTELIKNTSSTVWWVDKNDLAMFKQLLSNNIQPTNQLQPIVY